MSNVDSVRIAKNRGKISPQIFSLDNDEGPYKPVNSLDPNVYATKKTIAQGMLDVALLTANASQLKYCLQLGKKHQFFYLMVTLISSSIILQIIVGGLFVFVGYINFNDQNKQKTLNTMNNIATVFVFFITVINVLIAGFGFNYEDTLK